jgi:hypothetical protein
MKIFKITLDSGNCIINTFDGITDRYTEIDISQFGTEYTYDAILWVFETFRDEIYEHCNDEIDREKISLKDYKNHTQEILK